MSRHFARTELAAEHVRRLPDGSWSLAGGHTVSADGTLTLADGSLVVSPEQAARFGDGNPRAGRAQLRAMISDAADGRAIYNGPTERPVTVRIASIADEPALVELMVVDLKENAERVASIDEERILDHIQGATRRRGGVCGVIDGPDGKPVAVVMLQPFSWWFSRQLYYMEIMNFVHPDHRRSRHANDLLQFMRWWTDAMSKEFGYRVYLICGVLTARRVYAKKLMYKRQFAEVGGCYCYPSPGWKE